MIPVADPYQSNGSCQDTCKAQYAFAILKGNQCWCSNYAPGSQNSPGSCNSDCPGFPFEKCGNPDQDLYGYYQLNNNVAGTLGLSTAAPSTTQVSTIPPQHPSCSSFSGPLNLHSLSLFPNQAVSSCCPFLLTRRRRLYQALILLPCRTRSRTFLHPLFLLFCL